MVVSYWQLTPELSIRTKKKQAVPDSTAYEKERR